MRATTVRSATKELLGEEEWNNIFSSIESAMTKRGHGSSKEGPIFEREDCLDALSSSISFLILEDVDHISPSVVSIFVSFVLEDRMKNLKND